MCYGGEFTAKVVRAWLGRIDMRTLFIERSSPRENGYSESSNSKLRDEQLDREILCPLWKALVLIERWHRYYNTTRPHSALGYRPPAPEASLPSPSGTDYAQPRWTQPGAPKHGPTLS
jgi:transposase InsO family protein